MVAVFRTIVLVTALFVPRLLNGLVPIATPLIWLAATAGAYNLVVVGAYFWRGRLSLRRPFIIAMDLMLITLWIRLTSAWGLFPLYYVVVVVAAMWYRIWGGVLTAFCCNFLYVMMLMRSIIAYGQDISPNGTSPSLHDTFYLMANLPFLGTGFALNVALLFLIGSLVGSLALAQERERTRRLEEQLLLANYQREIDLATQMQPLLVAHEWFTPDEIQGETPDETREPTSTNASEAASLPVSNALLSDVLLSEEALSLSNALSSTRSPLQAPELLPRTRTTIASQARVRLGATMQTARDFGGGDYFDFIPLENGRSALCIADVSGKSVRAQARLPLLKYALRALAPLYSEPETLITRLNQTLAPDLQNDLFIGLCYIVLDPRANRLQWCNAGHIAPLLLPSHALDEKNRAIPELTALETLGPALGLFPETQYESKSASWRPGDRLLMFTDGLSDALSYRGREDGEEQIRHIALAMEASFWLEPQSVAQTFLALAQDAFEDRDTLLSRFSPLRRHNDRSGERAERTERTERAERGEHTSDSAANSETAGRASERRDDITVVVARRTLLDES